MRERNTDLRDAKINTVCGIMFWLPMAILLRNQKIITSTILSVIQAQQRWVGALNNPLAKATRSRG
jgi:hypothetical protein